MIYVDRQVTVKEGYSLGERILLWQVELRVSGFGPVLGTLDPCFKLQAINRVNKSQLLRQGAL